MRKIIRECFIAACYRFELFAPINRPFAYELYVDIDENENGIKELIRVALKRYNLEPITDIHVTHYHEVAVLSTKESIIKQIDSDHGS